MDNLQKFLSRCDEIFLGILIFPGIQCLWLKKVSVCKVLMQFEYSAGIQYLWQGEISVCKVLMPIKYVARKE